MSFPPATEMFQFAGFASRTYEFSSGYPSRVGCPIRRSRDQRLLASPPGLSQRATPFIASQCQGIHQMPFLRSLPGVTSVTPDKTRHSQGQKPPQADHRSASAIIAFVRDAFS
jgi:hypothetical protein